MSAENEVHVDYDMVQEQRGVGKTKVYQTIRTNKRDAAHARKGVADWEENKARVLDSGATFMQDWSVHIETRTVTETPWERLET